MYSLQSSLNDESGLLEDNARAGLYIRVAAAVAIVIYVSQIEIVTIVTVGGGGCGRVNDKATQETRKCSVLP